MRARPFLSCPPTTQAGLTLLEMIVVLLIASLAITLAFQSLGQWQRAKAAVSSISGAIQQDFLTEHWLNSSLRSLVPLEDQPFSGTSVELQGVSFHPVQYHQGGNTRVTWTLIYQDGEMSLRLNEDSQLLDIPLRDVTAARFSYQDNEGRLHPQWPPALGLHDQLPALIVLHQELTGGRQRTWASSLNGPRNPYYNPFELSDDF